MDTIPPLPQIPVPGKDGSVLGGGWLMETLIPESET